MRNLFNLDSPLMQGLNKIADLMWLNVLTIICCLPIITAGASLTAMNYVVLKIVRDEETYITKSFFKSFKDNFIQGTIIWILFVLAGLILIGDFMIMRDSNFQFSNIIQIAIMVAAILVLLDAVFVFPVLAKFDNTVGKTIKNALMIGIMQFPKAILMIILYAIPVIIAVFIVSWLPITFMFGFTGPAWCGAKMYNKFFKKLEDQIVGETQPEEEIDPENDERIFRDELDPALAARDENQQ